MSLDRVSNMLSSLKNGSMAKRADIEVVHTVECEKIAKVIQSYGFLDEVKTFKPKGSVFKGLNLKLTYEGVYPKFSEVKILSKPGRRLYYSGKDIAKMSADKGLLVVSTSKGIMSGKEAGKRNLGGEVICQLY